MPHPMLGIMYVLAALGGLLVLLAFLQRSMPQHPELIRKLLHVGMGIVTLWFPWLFDSTWPVLVLGAFAIGLLLMVKWRGEDRAGIHGVVHGVARNSFGEIYFPIAVCVLFVLSSGDTLLYVIPVLVLTLADAVAALIGVRYGQTHYRTDEGVKSLEGSVAFFVVTFVSVHISLLLFSDTGRVESVVIALLIGVLVMLLEAFAWRGLDNLFVPLGSFLLLKVYIDMNAPELWQRLAVSVGLVAFVVAWRTRTNLLDSAALASALIGYVVWAAGSWRWLMPVLLVFLTYAVLSSRHKLRTSLHDTRAVLSITLPGLLWLFMARTENEELLYYPFTVSFAIQLGLIALARLKHRHPHATNWWLVSRCALLGGAVILLPWALLMGFHTHVVLYVVIGIGLIGVAVLSFCVWQPGITDYPNDLARWGRQGSIGLIYSAASLPLAIVLPLPNFETLSEH